MKFLNIPISGNSKTARPSRRAVWQCVSSGGVILIVLTFMRLLSTSAPALAFIPEDTVGGIVFAPTHKQWGIILDVFGNEIVTEHGVGLYDIARLSRGPVVFTWNRAGKRSVVFSGDLSEKDKKALITYGIPFKEPKTHFYVLGSDSPNKRLKYPVNPIIRLFPHFGGAIFSVPKETSTWLSITKNRLQIIEPESLHIKERPASLAATALRVRFPKMSSISLNIPTFLQSAYVLLSGSETINDVVGRLLNDGQFYLDNSDLSLFVTSKDNTTLPSIQKLLELQEKLQNPSVSKGQLPDGSAYQEIRLGNQQKTSQISERGWIITRPIQKENAYFTATNDDSVALGNSKDLLVSLLQNAPEQKTDGVACSPHPFMSMRLSVISEILEKNSTSFSTAFTLSNTKFVNASLYKFTFLSVLELCM